MNNTILSVVIANYNYGHFLPCAIESIIRQCGEPVQSEGRTVLPVKGTDKCIELIICDARSSDDSVQVIINYSKYLTWWCSEKDNGQSAAFNKGFSHANGEWLTWLNADEEYLPGTFLALCRKSERHKNAKWITGNMFSFDTNTRQILSVNWGPHCQPALFTGNRACLAVFGPSSFFRAEVYREIGPINESFHYSMDLEYWARMTLAGIRQTRLNRICWAFRVHPRSISQGEMSMKKIAEGRAENMARRDVLGYTYEVSFCNPWYALWILMRVFDGSLLMRWIMRLKFTGRKFNGVIASLA